MNIDELARRWERAIVQGANLADYIKPDNYDLLAITRAVIEREERIAEMETTIASLAQALAIARNWRPLTHDALERIKEQREEINEALARARHFEQMLELACSRHAKADCPIPNDIQCAEPVNCTTCWRNYFESLAGDD